MEQKNPAVHSLTFAFNQDCAFSASEKQDRLLRAVRRLRKVVSAYPAETEGMVYMVSDNGIQVTFRPDETRNWGAAITLSRRVSFLFELDGLSVREIVIAPLSVVAPQHFDEINKPHNNDAKTSLGDSDEGSQAKA